MRAATGLLISALLAALGLPVRAQADAGVDIMAALHDSRWADADTLAAPLPDPVARKLVAFYRLLTPGAAHPAEIAAFMAANPDWPDQAPLYRRLQDAIASEGDDHTVLDICARQVAREVPSMLRCAEADSHAGRAPDAAEMARRAWLGGITDPAAEAAFARRWGSVLSFADQWRRFDRLAWTDNGAVGGPAWRQVARLDPAQRPAAEARLALRRDDPMARTLVSLLPPGAQADPALMLDMAKWLRRAGVDEDAQKLWLAAGPAAERAAPSEHRAAYWDERNLLARRRLRTDPAGAYALADQAVQTATEPAADAHFLAGFIALRRLDDTANAERHFQALGALSKAAITQARAAYWLGRTADARHDPAARAAYTDAAAWITTYYGQLAARALGEDGAQLAARIRASRDPAWDPDRAIAFAGQEMARAAALLFTWNEPRRARVFLLRLDELAADGVTRTLAARVAMGYGLPDLAVAIARRAGRDGWMLPEAGWPVPFEPPPGIDPAVALGIMRQESSFDPQATSPAGARGLMQLMPATAAVVARRLNGTAGIGANIPALTTDPAYNMRLGSAYLAGLLAQFGGVLPYAAAGYNAGPGRVADWLAANGDPASGALDMTDWIELIPFGETRNYVQRVMENVTIYRARAQPLLAAGG